MRPLGEVGPKAPFSRLSCRSQNVSRRFCRLQNVSRSSPVGETFVLPQNDMVYMVHGPVHGRPTRRVLKKKKDNHRYRGKYYEKDAQKSSYRPIVGLFRPTASSI